MRTAKTPMRRVRLIAALFLAVSGVIGPVWAAPVPAGAGPGGCANVKSLGTDDGTFPWAQQRLQHDKVHQFATGKGVTVAVIDSGLDQVHPEADAISVVNQTNVIPGFSPTDVLDCMDDGGHGTGVASIIAAPPQEGVGFRGLAPDAEIMPIKYLDPDVQNSGTADQIADGIRRATDAGVDVINLSLSTGNDIDAVRDAIRRAGNQGIVVVAASGNVGQQGQMDRYPGKYAEEFDHVLAVGAVDRTDRITDFSVRGSYVGVAAPGEGIRFPAPAKRPEVPEPYDNDSGTSFATPFVSATAALILEHHPKMPPEDVVARIKATADPPGVAVPDEGYGYGIVNPYLAVTLDLDDSRFEPREEERAQVAPPDLPEPPDRTLWNIAFAVSAGLFGLAVIFVIATIAWRHTTAQRRSPGTVDGTTAG